MGPKASAKARVASKTATHDNLVEPNGVQRHAAETQAGGGNAASKNARSDMEAYFDKLRLLDKIDNDNLGPKGIAQLMSDLNVAPKSMESFALLWRLGATRNGRLSRSEWVTATYTYNIDTPAQLKLSVNEWAAKARQGPQIFFDMYSFLYDYVRGEQSRLMTVECAVAAWEVFFSGNKTAAELVRWVREEYGGTVSRDLWRQLYYFVQAEGKSNTAEPDTTTRWPTVLSDFSAWNASNAKTLGDKTKQTKV